MAKKNTRNAGFNRINRLAVAEEMGIPEAVAVGLDAPLLGMLCAAMMDGNDRLEGKGPSVVSITTTPGQRLVDRILNPDRPVSTREMVGEVYGLMADVVNRGLDEAGYRGGVAEDGRPFSPPSNLRRAI